MYNEKKIVCPTFLSHFLMYKFCFLGGAKNYAYKTEKEETCCKVRGFTLNFKNSQLINFESIKSLVCSMDHDAMISIENPSKIVREAKRRKVVNKPEKKLYRIVYDKRILKDDFSTIPYGYK